MRKLILLLMLLMASGAVFAACTNMTVSTAFGYNNTTTVRLGGCTGNGTFAGNVTAFKFFGNLNASYITNAPWLTSFTEIDPIFSAQNSSIWSAINAKLIDVISGNSWITVSGTTNKTITFNESKANATYYIQGSLNNLSRSNFSGGLGIIYSSATGQISFNDTYGNATYLNEGATAGGDLTGTYPSPTVIWSNGNSKITIDASNVTSGTLADARLNNTGVAAGVYGGAAQSATLTVDSKGRITSASNSSIAITAAAVSGLSNSHTHDAANISSGTLPDARLNATGVGAGIYGGPAQSATLTIDSKGRVTAASNTSISITAASVSGLANSHTHDAGNITSGTLPDARLNTTAVVAGIYGNGTQVPQITIDSKGRITSATNVSITTGGTGTVTSVSQGLGMNFTTITTTGTVAMNQTGVSPGTYGNGTQVAQLTIDSTGRVVLAANVSIVAGSGTVTSITPGYLMNNNGTAITVSGTVGVNQTAADLNFINEGQSAGGDLAGTYPSPTVTWSNGNSKLTLDGANITSGTIPDARLNTTGVGAGIYGGPAQSATLTIDSKGRVTAASNTSISIAATAVSGLANSHTHDASNITTGTLPDTRLNTTGVGAGIYGGPTQSATMTVDSKGRVTAASNTSIALDASAIISGTLLDARLNTTGVAANTYGGAANSATITVDSKGRITTASNTSIAIAATAVSGLANSHTHDAANITSGTLLDARLNATGVGAGTYGGAANSATLTIDSKGRVTTASNTSISLGAGAIASGVLPIARGGTNAGAFGSGGIIYFDGTRFANDTSNFYYNATSDKLFIGTNGDYSTTSAILVYGDYDSYRNQSANNLTVDTYAGFSVSTSRGTGSVPLKSNVGDLVGGLRFYAYNGSAYLEGARIYSNVTGNGSNVGMQIAFATKTNSTSGSPVDRVVIADNGNVTFFQNITYAGTAGMISYGNGCKETWNSSGFFNFTC